MCNSRSLTGNSGTAFGIILFIAMLLPNPAVKLCIAPGRHIAIEKMDSECCTSLGAPCAADHNAQNRIEAAGDCGNCTDILIAFFGPETIPASRCASGLPACDDPWSLSTAECSSSAPRQRTVGNEVLEITLSSIPLLC